MKRYFLTLPEPELKPILDDYESWFGRDARRRAELTLPRWRAGTVEMSWRMIRRLYRLLPPRMSLDVKYELAENLWHHVGPASRTTFLVGLDASVEELLSAVRAHLDAAAAGYRIPDALRQRFEWLSAADVMAKQDLLNRTYELEKSLVLEASAARIPIVLRHMQGKAGRLTERLVQVFKIGKHELELIVDRNAEGVTGVEPRASAAETKRVRTLGRTLRSLVAAGRSDGDTDLGPTHPLSRTIEARHSADRIRHQADA